MNILRKGHIFPWLILCILFCSCNQHLVNIQALRPADITLSSNINTLLILDRTKYEHKGEEVIHDMFSGGIPGEDRAAAQSAISSLSSNLMLSPRFKVQVATEVLRGNSLGDAFPDPLSWEMINDLCREYHADGVVSFEIFGSDFTVTSDKRQVEKDVKDDKGNDQKRKVDEYIARGIGRIRMGIRIYDPKGMTISDQQLFTKTNNWEAKGDNKEEAFEHLIRKSNATVYVAKAAAKDYAYRIAPMPVSLSRNFYSKSRKTPAIESGTRQTEVNDWKAALTTWQNALTAQTPGKEAGKLCYDIAVAYEVLGNLDEAKNWASRGYVQYGNRSAKDYVNILEGRILDANRVDEQMK